MAGHAQGRIPKPLAAAASAALLVFVAVVTTQLTADLLARSVGASESRFRWNGLVAVLFYGAAIAGSLVSKTDAWLRRRAAETGTVITLASLGATLTIWIFGGATAIRTGRPSWEWTPWWGSPWWSGPAPHAWVLAGQALVAGLVAGSTFCVLRLLGPGAWATRARARRLVVLAWDRRHPVLILVAAAIVTTSCHIGLKMGFWRLPQRAVWVQDLLPEAIGLSLSLLFAVAWLEGAAARVRRAQWRRVEEEATFSGMTAAVVVLDALLAEFAPQRRSPDLRTPFVTSGCQRSVDVVNVNLLNQIRLDKHLVLDTLRAELVLRASGETDAVLRPGLARDLSCGARRSADTDAAIVAFVSNHSIGLLADRAPDPALAHAALRGLGAVQEFATMERWVCRGDDDNGHEFDDRQSLRISAVSALQNPTAPGTLSVDDRATLKRYCELMRAAAHLFGVLDRLVDEIGTSQRRYFESRDARAYWRRPSRARRQSRWSLPPPVLPPVPPRGPQSAPAGY